jgi:hypothetical protein
VTGTVPCGTVVNLVVSSGPPAPGPAANPSPANAATNVSKTADLSWTAGSGAVTRDVYFDTVNPPVTKVIDDGTALTYDTGTMSNNTTYYWRVDEKNAGGTTTGTVWSFTTDALVPDVVGMTEAEAITAIEAVNGLTVGTVTYEYSYTVEAGDVISQDPAGNTEFTDFAESAIGHWTMNDVDDDYVVDDSSGNENHGTSSWWVDGMSVPGKIEWALGFNGTSDYVDVDVAIDDLGTGSYTKAAWIKLESSTSTNGHHILSGNPGHAFWAPNLYSNKLSAGHNGIWNQVQDSDSLEFGVWCFVAVSYDSISNTLTLYKNGVVVDTGSTTAPAALTEFNIGKYDSTATYFKGAIDNVMLFDRVLTENEIVALYNDDNGTEIMPDESPVDLVVSSGPPPSVGIIGSWVTGTTHVDESGSNRGLIFIAHGENSSANPSLTSVTYGGQTMTKIIEKLQAFGSASRAYVAAFYLDEAGIAAATDSTFVPTWSNEPSPVEYSSVFLENVNQTTPIGSTVSKGLGAGSTLIAYPLPTEMGDMVIEGSAATSSGTYTVNNGFTKDFDSSSNDYDAMAGHKAATGADEMLIVIHTVPVSRKVLIGFVVRNIE